MFEIEEDGEIKTYNKSGTCIKCGYGGIEDVHNHETHVGFYAGEVPDHAKRPEHIARTCKNCGYSWQESPLDVEDENCSFNKFVDAIIKRASDATGISREDLLKGWDSHTTPDTPVIEFGDVVKRTDIHGGCCKAGKVSGINHDEQAVIIYADNRFGVAPLSALTLIRKGPKVITFEGMLFVNNNGLTVAVFNEIASSEMVAEYRKLEMNGKTYDLTLTERTLK